MLAVQKAGIVAMESLQNSMKNVRITIYTAVRVDHLSHLYPKLPLWYVVQDLCTTYTTRETRTRDHADCTASTRQHELLL